MVRTPQWVKGAIAAVGEGRIHRLQKTISKPPTDHAAQIRGKEREILWGNGKYQTEIITSKLSICKNASPSLTDSRSERYNPHRRTSLGQASAKPPQKHVFRFESV